MYSYPDKFLKGIPNSDKVDEDDAPTSDIFYFTKNEERDDDFLENSINWDDEPESAEHILKRINLKKENDELQFKAGYAIMCRHQLDHLLTRPLMKGVVSYERNVLSDNKYHGNLLVLYSISKPKMKRIAATIVLNCFEERIPNPYIK